MERKLDEDDILLSGLGVVGRLLEGEVDLDFGDRAES
jgi:hypothetical protein